VFLDRGGSYDNDFINGFDSLFEIITSPSSHVDIGQTPLWVIERYYRMVIIIRSAPIQKHPRATIKNALLMLNREKSRVNRKKSGCTIKAQGEMNKHPMQIGGKYSYSLIIFSLIILAVTLLGLADGFPLKPFIYSC